MTERLDDITRLTRACEPNEPLSPDDSRYVNCDEVRGENLVDLYARSLRRAEPSRPEIKLFAGHRGIGKTSELLRLKKCLEEGPGPFLVIYADASVQLDLNDLDFPELLVLIASETIKQLKTAKVRGFDPVTSLIKNAWEDIWGALKSDVSISEAEIGAEFASLTVEFRNRPSSRQLLRNAVEKHTTSLLHAVNDLLMEANRKLRNDGKSGLVLIVDGLERLVFRSLDGGTNTHDRLFIDRSEQLANIKTHTIYTMPISLFYSPRCASLEHTFGEHNIPVPMIRLHEFDGSVTPDTPGMKKMREIIAKRCEFAEVDFADAFDSADTCDYLCKMSGGHPRHLLMFLQAAMNSRDELPITRAAAEKAVRNYGNSLLREVPDEYWERLRAFAEPKHDFPSDEDHQRMLLLLHVFEYMNGEPWYEINPVIRTLPRFSATD